MVYLELRSATHVITVFLGIELIAVSLAAAVVEGDALVGGDVVAPGGKQALARSGVDREVTTATGGCDLDQGYRQEGQEHEIHVVISVFGRILKL